MLCTAKRKLCYTEDGAEASCSEYAAGGTSAFEDEAYGDVYLAKNDIVCRILGVEITYFSSDSSAQQLKNACAHVEKYVLVLFARR